MKRTAVSFSCGVLTLEGILSVPEGVGTFPAVIICERRMFGGHHPLKPALSQLTDITDEIDDLEQKYRARLDDLEQRLRGE